MASEIMHISIHTEVYRKMAHYLNNKNDYILSALAPDVYNSNKERKDITHFFFVSQR